MIENFHHFQKEISTRNVPVLMAFVREAENLYQRNRRALVELLIETKFRKLSGFFNEIDSLVLTIPLEEIQFQQSHNKQALRRITSMYSSGQIEKLLTKIYKNLLKNLSREENLIGLVWDALTVCMMSSY